MFRSATLFAVCLWLLNIDFAHAQTEQAVKYVGVWKGRIGVYDEIWVIKNSAGTWSINGRYRIGQAEVGSFIGGDITETGDRLSFVRKFIKRPNNLSNLPEDAKIVVKNEGENLSYTWSGSGKKGEQALEKIDGPAALAEKPKEKPQVTEKPEKPADDSLGKLRGQWNSENLNGYKVMMNINSRGDKLEVTGVYMKKGLIVGGWTSSGIEMKNGVLHFIQNYTKKPVSSWIEGKPHWVELVNDNTIRLSWKTGGPESLFRLR